MCCTDAAAQFHDVHVEMLSLLACAAWPRRQRYHGHVSAANELLRADSAARTTGGVGVGADTKIHHDKHAGWRTA